MTDERKCKFCKEMVHWEDLGLHMLDNHREKIIELFGPQIDEFLTGLVEDHFDSFVASNEA